MINYILLAKDPIGSLELKKIKTIMILDDPTQDDENCYA